MPIDELRILRQVTPAYIQLVSELEEQNVKLLQALETANVENVKKLETLAAELARKMSAPARELRLVFLNESGGLRYVACEDGNHNIVKSLGLMKVEQDGPQTIYVITDLPVKKEGG